MRAMRTFLMLIIIWFSISLFIYGLATDCTVDFFPYRFELHSSLLPHCTLKSFQSSLMLSVLACFHFFASFLITSAWRDNPLCFISKHAAPYSVLQTDCIIFLHFVFYYNSFLFALCQMKHFIVSCSEGLFLMVLLTQEGLMKVMVRF